MIRLYHGSNVAIENIDLSRSKRGKDFGQGFYLNANRDQAMAMAIRTTKLFCEGQPVLSCFEFDDTVAEERGLKVKRFPDYSEEWAEFVVIEGKTHCGADRNAQQQWADGFMGGVPASGYGAAAWEVYRAVPNCLLPAGQTEWAGYLFLQAPAGSRTGDLR